MSNITTYEFQTDKRPETKSDLVLYTSPICPHVQKVRLALLEKKVDYEQVLIDLAQPRPQWYLELNPKGLVPTLVHNGNLIFESVICAQYVDEAFNPDVPLLPKDNYLRAVARLFIQNSGDFYTKFFHVLRETDETQLEERKKELDQLFRDLDAAYGKYKQDDGPFFFGSQFSLVECMYLPLLERLVVLERLKGYTLPSDLKNVNALKEAGFARDSFKQTQNDPELFVEIYKKYI